MTPISTMPLWQAPSGTLHHVLGIAQASFDIAVDYTKDRMSAGKPVREWRLGSKNYWGNGNPTGDHKGTGLQLCMDDGPS